MKIEQQTLASMIQEAERLGAQQLHLTVGKPPVIRKRGELITLEEQEGISLTMMRTLLGELLEEEEWSELEEQGVVTPLVTGSGGRQRVVVFKTLGTYGVVVHIDALEEE